MGKRAITNNREQYDEAVADIRNHLDRGEVVEILTGPCAPLVVKDSKTLHEYKRRLWVWLAEPSRAWGAY